MACSHHFPSFGRFAHVLEWFWAKNGFFTPELQFLKRRSANCNTVSRLPSLSLWLILCVIFLHTQGYHPPKFQPNRKHHDGVVIFCPFRAHVCCCLLAAKPGRSILGPKEGYKTKTVSTSSETWSLDPKPVLYLRGVACMLGTKAIVRGGVTRTNRTVGRTVCPPSPVSYALRSPPPPPKARTQTYGISTGEGMGGLLARHPSNHQASQPLTQGQKLLPAPSTLTQTPSK